MNKIVYSILSVFFFILSFAKESTIQDTYSRKKILILTSKGGGGHTAVSNALKGYLADIYDLSVVNAFDEMLFSADPVRFLSFGKLSGEDFYNFCLQSRWISMLNRYVNMGSWLIQKRCKFLEDLTYDYIKVAKPDLVISVIPLVNCAFLTVVKKFDIPLLILTNDLDTTNYINGIASPDYDKFYYTIAFDDQDIKSKICANIPSKHVKVTGFPLRPDFFKTKINKTAIRRNFSVPNNKKVVMLLMGGAGSLSSFRYIQELTKFKTPLHIIACLGRNEKLRKKINSIKLPKHITLSVVGFTDKIADLMSISDVLITKPGPGSICEAIVSNLPIIVDQTSGILWWELMNLELVVKHSFGDVLTNFRDLNKVLDKYLRNTDYVNFIKNNMRDFIGGDSFEKNIKQLIEEILQNSAN